MATLIFNAHHIILYKNWIPVSSIFILAFCKSLKTVLRISRIKLTIFLCMTSSLNLFHYYVGNSILSCSNISVVKYPCPTHISGHGYGVLTFKGKTWKRWKVSILDIYPYQPLTTKSEQHGDLASAEDQLAWIAFGVTDHPIILQIDTSKITH